MKEKDPVNVIPEKMDNDLFPSFDPGDELWIVGGSKTITMGLTGTPTEPDYWVDADWNY